MRGDAARLRASREDAESRNHCAPRWRSDVRLAAHGYVVDDVRAAPDPPGKELVFVARVRSVGGPTEAASAV